MVLPDASVNKAEDVIFYFLNNESTSLSRLSPLPLLPVASKPEVQNAAAQPGRAPPTPTHAPPPPPLPRTPPAGRPQDDSRQGIRRSNATATRLCRPAPAPQPPGPPPTRPSAIDTRASAVARACPQRQPSLLRCRGIRRPQELRRPQHRSSASKSPTPQPRPASTAARGSIPKAEGSILAHALGFGPKTRDERLRILACKEKTGLKMQSVGNFKLPQFFNYPPYFTLQPVRETREKQVQLWKELILDYCRSQKIFIVGLEEEFPLFVNPAIERSLSHEAKEAFLNALVSEGRAEWMDKGHKKCLILWLRIQDWADCILNFVRENGLENGVMTIEDIRSGIESRGTELEGIDRGVLMRALRHLEQKGKAAIFKGSSTDDDGVKFSA